MKLLSINAEHTKSAHDVAFNVDAPPAAGVMEKISYGALSITFADGLLRARARERDPGIDQEVVQNLSATIEAAEKQVASEIAQQKRRHAAMLQALSESTGLQVK